jgi:predicted O-methyltransferase YrrM
MPVIDPEIEKYIERHTSAETEMLSDLNRQTHADILMPQMLSGKVQGQVLQFLSQMLRPQRVLEIGTYTGYSAICLAAGLPENGKLYTLDINEELEEMVRGYFERAGLNDKIEYIIGDATKIIPALNETFDLVFIDADKINYSVYYDLVFDKVRSGGYILADNVLWSGKVLDAKKDKDTQAIDDFNQMVHNDPRVEHVILSVRDGVMMIRKK